MPNIYAHPPSHTPKEHAAHIQNSYNYKTKTIHTKIKGSGYVYDDSYCKAKTPLVRKANMMTNAND